MEAQVFLYDASCRDKVREIPLPEYFSRKRLADAGYFSPVFRRKILALCKKFHIHTMHQLLAARKMEFAGTKTRAPRTCTVIELVLLADGIAWR